MGIRIGILGYGNLGRGIECAIKQNPDMELAAVFTRRNPESVQILTEGTSPAEMPIEYYPSEMLQLVVNEETAAELGIDVAGITLE